MMRVVNTDKDNVTGESEIPTWTRLMEKKGVDSSGKAKHVNPNV